MGEIKKKIGQKIAAGAIVAAFLGGTVAGGVTMSEMIKSGDAKNLASNYKTRAEANPSYSQMVRTRDEQIWEAYDNKIINSNEFTQQMGKTHSEENVYANRYQLLSREEAIAWEDAKTAADRHEAGMVSAAIGAGVLLGVGALACLNKGHKLMKEAEEEENIDEDVKIFGE